MCRWRNRRKCNHKGRGGAAAPQDTALIQETILRSEVGTIRLVWLIGCATWRATFRARTRASDRSQSRLAPTSHFAARRPATRSAQKNQRRMRLQETTMVPIGAPPERAGEM